MLSSVTSHRVFPIRRFGQELGIAKLLHRPMGSLSGGEERRVALAAALVDLPQTDLLILDEFPGLAMDGAPVSNTVLCRKNDAVHIFGKLLPDD